MPLRWLKIHHPELLVPKPDEASVAPVAPVACRVFQLAVEEEGGKVALKKISAGLRPVRAIQANAFLEMAVAQTYIVTRGHQDFASKWSMASRPSRWSARR
jgi:hypothetical protein